MGQRRGCDEWKELLAGAASPGCGLSLMRGTGDMELALPYTSCHIHRISRAQNHPSTPLMESRRQGPWHRVRPDLGDLSSSPSSRTSSGKGWTGARDAKPRSPGATLEPPERTSAPLGCWQRGSNPRARPGRGEEKQLGCSGATLLANNRGQTTLINTHSSTELVCTTRTHPRANLTGEEHRGSRAKLHRALVNSCLPAT